MAVTFTLITPDSVGQAVTIPDGGRVIVHRSSSGVDVQVLLAVAENPATVSHDGSEPPAAVQRAADSDVMPVGKDEPRCTVRTSDGTHMSVRISSRIDGGPGGHAILTAAEARELRDELSDALVIDDLCQAIGKLQSQIEARLAPCDQ